MEDEKQKSVDDLIEDLKDANKSLRQRLSQCRYMLYKGNSWEEYKKWEDHYIEG